MEKSEFVKNELVRFEENHSNPFRVAVSDSHNGGAYAYGCHTGRQEYADITIGWAQDSATAEKLLAIAWEEADKCNAQFWVAT